MVANAITIMGVDPGLQHSGLTCISAGVRDSTGAIVRFGEVAVKRVECCTTKKCKRKERRSDEDLRSRLWWVVKFYEKAIEEEKPLLAVFESLSWVRNASASAKVGLAWGSAHAVFVMKGIPVFVLTPQEIKKGCGLERNASKEAVQEVIRNAWPSSQWETVDKAKAEHVFDAAGAIYAFMRENRDLLNMIRSASHV